MELLAPAGGLEQLQYAVRFGADAVYLACDRFGMRQRASNFTLEEIPAAIGYAHAHDVKVYVTLNIVMHDDDVEALPTYLTALRDTASTPSSSGILEQPVLPVKSLRKLPCT